MAYNPMIPARRGRGRGGYRRSSFNMSDINKIVNSRIRTATKGESFAPPAYPMTLCLQPWNAITVRILKTLPPSGLYITVQMLYEALAKQSGAYVMTDSTTYKNVSLEFKVVKIMAWNLTSEGFLRMLPIDFTTTTRYDSSASTEWKSELANVDGRPAKNAYAGVGYTYPNSFQNFVLFQATEEKKPDLRSLVYFDGTNGSEIEVHYHVLWRGMASADIQKVFVSVPTEKYTRRKKHEGRREKTSDDSDEDYSDLGSLIQSKPT